MKQILVTANDTGVGKTWVSSELVREYREQGLRVGYVKVVETGVLVDGTGDTEFVQARNPDVPCETLLELREPLAPLAAAELEGLELGIPQLLELLEGAAAADVRIIEGVGGIAVPLDEDGGDLLTFAKQAGVDTIVAVVEDRLGAINQSRLLENYLEGCGIPFALRLNAISEVDEKVREVNKAEIGMRSSECRNVGQACQPDMGSATQRQLVGSNDIAQSLESRRKSGMLRNLQVYNPQEGGLNLADNDYLGLSRHPKVVAAAQVALEQWGCSASASPLVTGRLAVHRDLEDAVCQWHGFPHGMVWNSGFQANRSILGMLPKKGDLVLADRLVHRSMISGILQSGAQFRRYRHLDLGHLEDLLERGAGCLGRVFVVTESVFSMDGDAPDLRLMAELKSKHGFFWIVDEAHALGWYGVQGSGLVEAAGVAESVDILVGTLSKTLGSQGAYALFREGCWREYLINFAEDFVYSTYLAPASVGAALVAVGLVQEMCGLRTALQDGSRRFRKILQETVPDVPDQDSPIVPVVLGDVERTGLAHQMLRQLGILTGCIRPPTVPQGTSRLRISLKADLDFEVVAGQVASVLGDL